MDDMKFQARLSNAFGDKYSAKRVLEDPEGAPAPKKAKPAPKPKPKPKPQPKERVKKSTQKKMFDFFKKKSWVKQIE